MRPKKRIFIGLLLGSLIFFVLITYGIFYLYFNRVSYIYQNIMIAALAIAVIVMFIIFLGIGAIVLTIFSTKTYPPLQKLMSMAVKILYPTAIKLGKILNISKERIRASFIEVNNHLVLSNRYKVEPDRLLILVPHCIQKSSCPYKITNNIKNCKRCGKCQITDLLNLSDQYGTKLAVVSGGTLARKYVNEFKPDAIVAIACERDLSSGIQDTYPIPVLGVLNKRPEGPCMNTRVDLEKVEAAINYFLE